MIEPDNIVVSKRDLIKIQAELVAPTDITKKEVEVLGNIWQRYSQYRIKATEYRSRNLKVVKRIVSEGYGHMLKRTCVDQYKKKCFIFYANDRIAEIKN